MHDAYVYVYVNMHVSVCVFEYVYIYMDMYIECLVVRGRVYGVRRLNSLHLWDVYVFVYIYM